MAEPAIETRDLVKEFDRRPERGLLARVRAWRRPKEPPLRAVDGVTLDVKRGELFGLLGPNGAGKTTTVKLLATLLLPTSGTARVAGFDVETDADAIRRAIGVVLGGERALYWRLTARENLWYFSQLYNMPNAVARPRIDALLAKVGLAERADDRVETYSKGMKQRLHIARGLLNEPRILLMDEPSIGLDPHAARDLRALVRRLADEGTTIVLTTHYMFEADALSDRVAVMNRGRVIALDRPSALKAAHADASTFVVVAKGGDDGVAKRLEAVGGVERVTESSADPGRGTRSYRVLAARDVDSPAIAAAAGAALVALARDEPTLEDVFVKLTGGTLAATERGGGADGDE